MKGIYSAFTHHIMEIMINHKLINSTGIGEVDDYSVTGEDLYPRGFLELPIQSEFGENNLTFDAAFTISDLTKLERGDEQSDLNKVWDIAMEIMEGIKDPESIGYTASTFTNYLVDDYRFLTLTRFKDDYTSAVRVEFRTRAAIPVDTCSNSGNFDFVAPPFTCNYVINGDTNYEQNYCLPNSSNLYTPSWQINGITCPTQLRVNYVVTEPPNPDKIRFHVVINNVEFPLPNNQTSHLFTVNAGDVVRLMVNGQNMTRPGNVQITGIDNVSAGYTISGSQTTLWLNDPNC